VIRSAQPSDAAGIARVHVRSWQQAYAGLMPAEYLDALEKTLTQREAGWRKAIEDAQEQAFVALVEGEIVGWVAVGGSRDAYVEPQETGEVRAIYVRAEYWRSGIGRALWVAAINALIEQGFKRVTLWVLADNQRAISFYSRAGLAPEIASRRSLSRGGRELEEVRYQGAL